MKIRHKLLCVLAVPSLLSIVAMTAYLDRRESQQHLDLEISNGVKLGEGLARYWDTTMLLTGSDNLARDQLFNQKAGNALLSIELKRNKKLTRINPESSPYASRKLEKRVIAEGKPAFEILSKNDGEGRRLHVLVPLTAKPECVGCHQYTNNHPIEDGEVMGVISLLTSLEAVDVQIASDRLATFLSLLGIFFVTLVICYLTITRVTRPITNLTQASKAMAAGNLEVQVLTTSKDELGVLGNAFNLMVEKVKTSRKTLEAHSMQLEEKVGERTQELEVQKVYLEQLLENAPEAIVVLDDQDRIIRANTEFTRMFGYAFDEALGCKIDDLIVPDGDEKVASSLSQKIQEGHDVSIETVRRRKDGTTLDVSLLATPIRLNGGNLAVYAIYRDITERKRAEEELQEAKEAAESGSRAKSEFLANMSHEIRTPMNGIIGFSDLLADEELSPDQMEYVETIRGSAESLLTIINDILDFSKIEAGKLDFEFIDFDLRTSMEEVADLLAFKAEDKGLSFSCFLHPQVEGFVNGDPGRLKQILLNLANNAVKFTKLGEVAIRGELERETETEICVRFSVTDTGIGIPKKAQQKLFQSFSQVDASTTRKFGGTGLGLTISKQLAEMMGGEIGVESEAGKGSTFWFTVLLKKQPETSRQRPVNDIDLTGTRILVIDDNKTNRDILRLQLQAWHCMVEEAEDATEALKLLHQQAANKAPFTIAFVDMQMPGMDGETLGKIIKNEVAIKDTILIMFTSIGQRGDASRVSETGFDAYLTKPLKQSQLYDCLITLLGLKETAAQETKLVTRHTLAENRKLDMKILLVEDNSDNQKIAMRRLEKLGYIRVECVDNGKKAVEAVESKFYDLVLMDCQMPEMDGYEATAAIRRAENEKRRAKGEESGANSEGRRAESEERGARIPIIAMTANAMQGDRERCLAAGMDDYISKPINAAKLIEALERWSERYPQKIAVVGPNQSALFTDASAQSDGVGKI